MRHRRHRHGDADRLRHRDRAHDDRLAPRRARRRARRRGRRARLGDPAADDPRLARRGRHRRRRSRRDRVRARPGRVHRAAHGVLGRARPGFRRRQACPADRQPARRRRGRARRRDALCASGRCIDARMDQIYAAEYELRRRTLDRARRAIPDRLRFARGALAATSRRRRSRATRSAPSARDWPPATPRCSATPTPTARALLRLAEHAWAEGAAVEPALALPLYVRDKVAQTEAERAALRAAKGAPKEPAPPSRREGSEAGREQSCPAKQSEAGRIAARRSARHERAPRSPASRWSGP